MKKIRIGILVFAAACLAWMLHQIGFLKIADSLQRIGSTGALIIVAAGIIEAGLDAIALQQAVLGRVPYWKVLLINQNGAFLNLFAPLEAGEVLKATLLSRQTPRIASTAVLVWNMAARLVKSSAIFIAAGAAFLLLSPFRSQAAACLGFAAANLGVYAAFALILRLGGVGRILHLLSKLPFLKGERAKRLVSHVRDAEEATARFWRNHPARYVAIFAAETGARTLSFAVTWAALHFMLPNASFLLVLLIHASMELAGYFVALLPTRVGTLEGSAFLVFEFLGLDGGVGVVLQIVLRLKQLLITGSLFTAGYLSPIPFRSQKCQS